MFDMGFEPQIKRILNMIRPDRQTVMFSATFPKAVENMAKTALTKPVEILIGGRSIVNKDIEQVIEVRPEEQRFLRLLELLGHWYVRNQCVLATLPPSPLSLLSLSLYSMSEVNRPGSTRKTEWNERNSVTHRVGSFLD